MDCEMNSLALSKQLRGNRNSFVMCDDPIQVGVRLTNSFTNSLIGSRSGQKSRSSGNIGCKLSGSQRLPNHFHCPRARRFREIIPNNIKVRHLFDVAPQLNGATADFRREGSKECYSHWTCFNLETMRSFEILPMKLSGYAEKIHLSPPSIKKGRLESFSRLTCILFPTAIGLRVFGGRLSHFLSQFAIGKKQPHLLSDFSRFTRILQEYSGFTVPDIFRGARLNTWQLPEGHRPWLPGWATQMRPPGLEKCTNQQPRKTLPHRRWASRISPGLQLSLLKQRFIKIYIVTANYQKPPRDLSNCCARPQERIKTLLLPIVPDEQNDEVTI